MINFNELKNSRGWLVILLTIIGLVVGAFTYINRATSEQVYIKNCGLVDFKPKSLTTFCADAGVVITNLEWKSWGSTEGTATGTYMANDCKPDCATGKWHSKKVEVKAANPEQIGGKIVLTQLIFRTEDGKNLPLSKSPENSWELP
ncbi:MAG: hypothetical protein WCI68_07015 [Actinomycetes bacterium]